ncbi:thymidylate synthase [Erythrobacteraceae bacterium CFH 75059]|uniref:thymidylate synthase n=1 Tax=Qipengyuania thermophila TaxID=2509361 RepID=UPI00101EAF94|nr:thymidylate synthase [Qipengyuania thermophila]TCD05070.1 thymidylate synthase [Erythrobacteraceae bacterium CFH 75059]
MADAASTHPEEQYLALMRDVWARGSRRMDRTGVGTRSVFGATLRFDLADGHMPLLTTKRVYWKTATRELLWFLSGSTNIRPLVLQGVKIWNEWPHARYVRETGDALSLEAFVARIAADEEFAERWGDLGPVYGRQWTAWPTYRYRPDGTYEPGEPVNQVAEVVESLRRDPAGRRHIIEGWNVAQLAQMALPPCHKTYQYHVVDGRLNGMLYQRSCDVALGLPFNLWTAATLQRMLAQQTGLAPGELVWTGGDVHLYESHADLVERQLERRPVGRPRLVLRRRPASIFAYDISDFEVLDYTPLPPLTASVAV